MLISLIHTAAEVGLILVIARLIAMQFAGTPVGAAISFVYGTGS